MTLEDMAWRPVVAATNAVERVALRHQALYPVLLVNALEPLRWGISRHRAADMARRARSGVPAYGDHYRRSRRVDLRASTWDRVPVTDKESFVKRYRIEDRCWGGSLPTRGVTVDESSESTGTPTNWVRGWDERMDTKKLGVPGESATFGIHTHVALVPTRLLERLPEVARQRHVAAVEAVNEALTAGGLPTVRSAGPSGPGLSERAHTVPRTSPPDTAATPPQRPVHAVSPIARLDAQASVSMPPPELSL